MWSPCDSGHGTQLPRLCIHGAGFVSPARSSRLHPHQQSLPRSKPDNSSARRRPPLAGHDWRVLTRDMETHMPRKTLLSTIALAAACLCGAGQLSAQTAAVQSSVPTADTTQRIRMLPAQRVTAAPKATREGVLALMDENRRLMGELRRQDRKVDSLERRLAYLRGPLTDSYNRDIARMGAEAAETRARREALEARLEAMEGTTP